VPKLIKLLLLLLLVFSFCQDILIVKSFGQKQEKTLNPAQKLKGLNAPVVMSVIKDSKGFMWFTTIYGLVRYDGYSYKTYSYRPGEPNSLPEFTGPSKLLEGNDGRIWIATRHNMLIEFDPARELFISYRLDTLNSNVKNMIIAMYLDKKGNLWMGLQYEGFYLFNTKEKTFKLYRQHTKETIHNIDYVNALIEINQDQMLIGTMQGLFILDIETDSIRPFDLVANIPDDFGYGNFTYFAKDKNDNIWIGSAFGLYKYDQHTGEMEHVVHDQNDAGSFSDNFIDAIFTNPLDDAKSLVVLTRTGIYKINIKSGEINYLVDENYNLSNIYDAYLDESGLLWLATDNQGVFFIDLKPNPFRQYTVKVDGINDINYSGSAFYTDSRGDFWVATPRGGLYQYNSVDQLKKKYDYLPHYIYNEPFIIYSMFEDSKENFWIASWVKSLYLLDRETEQFRWFELDYPLVDLPWTMATEMIEDSYGRLWVGSGFGPFYYDLYSSDSIYFTWVDFPLLRDADVRSMCEDKYRNIWFTTSTDGLFCLTPENRDSLKFINYRHNPNDKSSISSNNSYNIHYSTDSTLWIATPNGLNRFDPESNTFEKFDIDNGFNAHFVFCVRSDDLGNLWVSTEKGLARFNPDSEEGRKFKLMTEYDGLPFDLIYPYHFDKDKDGMIYVGGNRGFEMGYFGFQSDSIKDNTEIPPVLITDIKVKNEPISLDTNISYKKHLSLNYNQNFISFQFASLDYNDPESNSYAYMLEGMDDNWIYSGNQRFTSYTGLSPGKYVFHVKGSNNDGYWNETGTSLIITIATPPWKTWWAYLIYVLLMLAIAIILIRYYLRRQQLLLQLEMEHLESDKLKEIDSIKSKFFANISHEFRTPLTLILGPVNKLRELIKDKVAVRDLDMMERNANQLKRLINQILDLTKLEAGKLQLKASEINIVQLIKSYIQSFESLARQKNIGFNFHSEEDNIQVYADKEKLEQIMNNLLANAFKYTSDGDNIIVSINHDKFPDSGKDAIKIKIKDSGQGISKNDLPFLFDRFYQAGDNKNSQGGTGIGLTLVKELVELHKGIIEVVSEYNIGTTFSIYLLPGTEHLKETEIIKSAGKTENQVSDEINDEEKYIIEADDDSRDEHINYGIATMLIVEDNDDMRSYIRGHFEKNYKIIEAVNGKEGFDKAIEYIPDIIVSDVMMPEMNGNEMCKLLKSDERSSHIPVILLTARSSGADKIEGLETGADDFITKPFDAKELQVRIKNLINQREKISEYYNAKIAAANNAENLQIEADDISSMDEQFLKKALKTVEEHIADEQFSVEDFSLEMAFSRMQLHRKLTGLTGQSATDFIRTIRLNKAAKLLASKSGTVTEIAYQVGFNSLSWFTKCFKEQYGLSPSEFAED